MKKLIALLLALVMVLGLVACGGNNDSAADTTAAPAADDAADTTAAPAADDAADDAAPAGDFKVAISVAEYNEWNQLYEKVIASKCEEYGWSYEIFDSKQDASTQIDQVNSIIAQGFDAMTIQAVDMAALAPVVTQAAGAGVIVVDHYGFTADQVAEDAIYKVLFGQKESGILQAEELIKIMGTSGKVAIIAGLTGADNSQARTAGYEEVLSQYPDIEIVSTIYCDWDTTKAQTAAEDILTANPDLNAFLVQDDGMSKGVWNAIEAAGVQDSVILASQGFYEWSIPYIEEGKFAFSITYPAGFFARDAMEMIYAVANGEAVDHVVYLGMELVTAENAATADHD